jgi:type IV secretory pathway VirB6-like protein
MENVFYDRAGHSKCRNYGEHPSADGSCPGGLYAGNSSFTYKKGNQVKSKSFFRNMQDTMQDLVRLVLTMSVMFFGMNMLIQKKGFDLREKKDMLVYLFKIVTILYFATGDAWQQKFFDGVYGSSSEFARMVFKIETQQSPLKRDGCQFGSVTTPDGITTPTEKSYPAGKSYLAIWDTLDCKIMRYLGFGPEDSVANIASLILAGALSQIAAIGLFFAISAMFFGICLIAATVRALHIFLSSCIAIIIMVFVSPLIFPTLLFEKTKGMFDKWLTNLISYCLQPMILFAYIAIFITVLDRTVIGDATFVGSGPFKTISCKKYCQNSLGAIVPYDANGVAPACDRDGEEIINPLDNSVACLINAKDFGTFPGFELIGLTIPIMVNLFSENARERVLTMLKGALVMFLLYKFMDEIPSITGKLIGSSGLSGGASGLGGNAVRNFMKVGNFLRNAQKRALEVSQKAGGGLAKKVSGMSRGIGDKGKSEKKNLTSGKNADRGGSQDESGGNSDNAGGESDSAQPDRVDKE